MTVTYSRVDIDHYPVWIDENPALFAQSVRQFLENHPAELWDCRIGKHAYLIRLTATAKASGAGDKDADARRN